MKWPRFILPAIILLVGATISACGGASPRVGTGSTTSGTTSTPKPSTSPTISITTSPAALCSLVSVAQFAQISGSPIDTIKTVSATISAPGFMKAIGCQGYASGTPVATYGFDFFDSAVNADAYYAKQQQGYAAQGVQTTAVSGLGDMAFYALPTLAIAKGSVLIIIYAGLGDELAADKQLAQLIIGDV